MKKTFTLIGLLFFAFAVAGCNKNEKPEELAKVDGFDYGRIENGKYINNYFGFELPIPSGWTAKDENGMKPLADKGKEVVADGNERIEKMIDASKVTSATMLGLFQYEVGAKVDFNPNAVVVAENLKGHSEINTGNDYLAQARKTLIQTQLQYDTLSEVFTKTTIGGHDFYSMDAILKIQGIPVHQVYYATIMKGFALGFILSYSTPEQKTMLENVLKSIKFAN